MSTDKKRARTVNWDEQEKKTLVEVITPYLPILEDKRKSTSCNRQKEDSWKKVQSELLCQGYNRELIRIKEQWTRVKLQSKKTISKQRLERKVTGGGSPCEPPSEIDLLVAGAVPHLYFVDDNIFDSDGDIQLPEQQSQRIENTVAVIPLNIEADELIVHDRDVSEIQKVSEESPQTSAMTSLSSGNILPNPAIVQPKQSIKTKKVNASRSMSAYEEEMLTLNKRKYEQAMRHVEELHIQKIKNEQELHDLKMYYERLLYEKKLNE